MYSGKYLWADGCSYNGDWDDNKITGYVIFNHKKNIFSKK